jgi:hypothetical protein
MKKTILTAIILFASLTAFAQTDTTATFDSVIIFQLQQNIEQLQADLKNQKANFSKQLSATTDSIAKLQAELGRQKATIAALADSLGVKISETATNAETQIAGVNNSIGNKTLYSIISGAALLLLSVIIFEYLRRKQKSNKTDIEERLIKEYSKQADVMDSLLKTLRELPVTAAGEPDHSLALKLADEITLMERNISLMDSNTKGLKQLNRSIGKLKDNLAANGYEIPELLGKPYNEGMKATITNTIQDENLEKGVELITKIVKPQVNYKDKMIQAAQIEVSVG